VRSAIRIRPLSIATFVVFALLLLSGAARRGVATAQEAGISVTYQVGWNLVGGPDGTIFGTPRDMYSLGPDDTDFVPQQGNAPIVGGLGYWAYFSMPTTVTLNGPGYDGDSIDIPAGMWVLVGNPSGNRAAVVDGADAVDIFDAATARYVESSTIPVGQGAWVYSSSDTTVSVTAFGDPVASSPAPPSQSVPAGPVFAVTMFVDPTKTTINPNGPGTLVYEIDAYKAGAPVAGAQITSAWVAEGNQANVIDRASGFMDSPKAVLSIDLPATPSGTVFYLHVEASLPGYSDASADSTFRSP
jgi:hypothetical protein